MNHPSLQFSFRLAVNALESYRTPAGINPATAAVLTHIKNYPEEFPIRKSSPHYWSPGDWLWTIEPLLSGISSGAFKEELYYAALFHAIDRSQDLPSGSSGRAYADVTAQMLADKISHVFPGGNVHDYITNP